jgi:threonine/homoserine/homoserine lactone efflux protein
MEFAVLKGIGLGLFLAISVGPIVFTILKLSMNSGHKAGYTFIAGVSFSDFVLAVLGNVAAEFVRSVLKYSFYIAIGGSVLLIVLGIWSLIFGKEPQIDNSELPPAFRRRDLAKYGLQGFFMNALNPGPIFFWLTTATAFAYLPLNERIVLFATTIGIVLTTDILKVKLAGKIRHWLTPSHLHKIHIASALILIVFGLIIAAGLFFRHH